jgi:hypothetical protein
VGHLRQHGFSVKSENTTELQAIKAKHGIPADLRACHTAIVDGYVVEGHVPADLIVRLLRERPRVIGLAVPGMPAGSPGMESDDSRRERYRVFVFETDGDRRVFATR